MNESKTFETLNALRGIAAIAVVLFHSHSLFGMDLAPGGYLAVDLFFVLSGFVIAHAYERRLVGGMAWADFALARVIRFYPLLLLAVAIGVVRAVAGIATGSATALTPLQLVETAAASLFLVPAPVTPSGNLFVLNVPLWTLCFELVVNFLYAAVVRHLRTPVLIVCIVLSAAIMAAFAIGTGDNDNGAVLHTAAGGLARAICGFSIGVLLFRQRVGLRAPPLLAMVILGVLLLAPMPSSWRVSYDIVFALIVAPLLVTMALEREPAGWLAPVARYLGALSFSLYAIHQPLLGMTETIALKIGFPTIWAGVGLIAALLVAAPLLETLYDRPVRRRLRTMANRYLSAATPVGRRPSTQPVPRADAAEAE